MKEANQPIGIFDSGIGGLTVANAIYNQLPTENIIYFGDTAHLPYGDKSPETIREYAYNIADFLLEQNCKAIVIACNSASSHAYEALKEYIGDQALLINVIDPIITALKSKKYSNVGIIGTRATIGSEVYQNKIAAELKGVKASPKATPLLASYIEEGFFKKPEITQLVLKEYLSDPVLNDIDVLILACTHYPLIKKEIDQYYDKKVDLMDNTKIVAKYVQELLAKEELLNKVYSDTHHFYVSDYTSSFEQTAKMFFKQKIKLELFKG